MAVEIETVGTGANWYGQGLYENMSVVDATTVEGVYFEGVGGGSVTVVSPLELGVLLGFGINWNVWAKHIELHGIDHWSTAFSDSWYQQNTNFSATSIGSHTQTVKGSTTWTNEGGFTLVTDAPQAKINITTVNSGTITLAAGAGRLALAATATSLAGDETSVTGTTKLQLSGGGNSVLLDATGASLMCGNAGIKATAASTVISGTKVEIGLPNAPNQPVAMTKAVSNVTNLATMANAEAVLAQTRINQLQEQLNELKTKCVPKATYAAKFAAAISR